MTDMRLSTAAAVVILVATSHLAAQQGKPTTPDRPIRTTSTRAPLQQVAFAADNTTLYGWDAYGFARWDPETNKTLDRQPVIAKACAENKGPLLPRSEDGRTIAANCAGKLVFFDMATGAMRGEFKFDPKQIPTIYTQSPNGATMAAVGAGNPAAIQVVDAKSGQRGVLIQNEQEVQQMSFSASGDLLVTGAVDGVRLWRLPEGQLLRKIPGGTFHALSTDAQTLAMERGRDVAIIDMASGEVKQALPGAVTQLRFSQDGSLLAGWNNQQLTVWEVASGKPRLTLKGSRLVTVALSNDAKSLSAVALEYGGGGAMTSVGVWRIPPP